MKSLLAADGSNSRFIDRPELSELSDSGQPKSANSLALGGLLPNAYARAQFNRDRLKTAYSVEKLRFGG